MLKKLDLIKKLNEKRILILILIFSFLLRALIASQPVKTLLTKIILDDSFYNFLIAKSIITGKGITYNGIDKTSGTQPLWEFLISPFFLLPNNVNIHAVLFFSAMIDTITIFLIYRITRKFFNNRTALLSASLYGVNPIIAFITISGMDAVLSMFIVTLIFCWYYYDKNKIILSILIGLSILTRIDNIFLLISLFIVMLFQKKETLFKILKLSVLSLLIVSPWILWIYVNFGTIIQSSATLAKLMSNGMFKGKYDVLFLPSSNAAILTIGSFLRYFGIIDINLEGIILSLLIAIAVLISLYYGSWKNLLPWFIFAIFFVGFYLIYFNGFYPPVMRYLIVFTPLVCILIGSGVTKIKNNLIIALFLVSFFCLLYLGSLKLWDRGYYPWQSLAFDNAMWIKNNSNIDDVIGSFNSGIIGFYSERLTINLDGILDSNALKANQERRIVSYMKERNISYWLDAEIYFPPQVYYDAQNNKTVDILRENRWINNVTVEEPYIDNFIKIREVYGLITTSIGRNITSISFVFRLKN